MGLTKPYVSGSRKLTVATVKAIRLKRSQGMSYPKLGRFFHIHHTTAWGICQRRAWKHVD